MIDPACRMRVEPEQSPARTIYGDKTFWFCTNSHRNEFDQDPQRFIRMREDELRAEGQIG